MSKWFWGLLFIALGSLWLASNLGLLVLPQGVSFWDLWPIIFVFIGIGIITSKPPWQKFKEDFNVKTFHCGDVEWDDEEIRNEIADSIKRVSDKVAKKIEKGKKSD